MINWRFPCKPEVSKKIEWFIHYEKVRFFNVHFFYFHQHFGFKNHFIIIYLL